MKLKNIKIINYHKLNKKLIIKIKLLQHKQKKLYKILIIKIIHLRQQLKKYYKI